MRSIKVYDTEAERIDELCDKHDATEAQIIEALFSIMDWHDDNIEEYI